MRGDKYSGFNITKDLDGFREIKIKNHESTNYMNHHVTLDTPLYDTNMTFTTSVAAVFGCWVAGH